MAGTNDLEYILNEKNKYITAEYIERTLKNHGVEIKVNNLEYFQKAMIHLSYLVRDEKFYRNSKTKPYQLQSTDIEPLIIFLTLYHYKRNHMKD